MRSTHGRLFKNLKLMAKRLIISIVTLSTLYLGLAVSYEKDAVPFIARSNGNMEAEVQAVKETIEAYNTIFADLFATDGVPVMLNEFPASKQLKHEVFRNIGALRSSKRVLVYDRASIKLIDVNILSPLKAEVVVFEEWNYVYQDAADRLPVSQMKGMGQGFRYLLHKAGDKWLVVDYFPLDISADMQAVEGGLSSEGH